MPFDLAFSLSPRERIAFAIVFSQFHGAKFDFDRMRFEDPPKA